MGCEHGPERGREGRVGSYHGMPCVYNATSRSVHDSFSCSRFPLPSSISNAPRSSLELAMRWWWRRLLQCHRLSVASESQEMGGKKVIRTRILGAPKRARTVAVWVFFAKLLQRCWLCSVIAYLCSWISSFCRVYVMIVCTNPA